MKKRKEFILGNLFTLQRQMGVTKDQFAAKAGLSIGTLRNVWTGQNCPSLDTLIKISQNLKVSMDDLCTENGVS